MGASSSVNVSKTVTNFVTSVIFTQTQNSIIASNTSTSIVVINTTGDVVIGGNTLNSQGTIDLTSALQSMNNTAVKTEMTEDMTQSAKALIKDINLGNVSSAVNEIDTIINQTMTVSTNLLQTCSANVLASATITTSDTQGNVSISDNHLSSALSVIQSCVAKSVSNSNTLSSADVKLSQISTSSTTGVSIWGFATIAAIVVVGIAVVILGPVALPIMAAGKNPKILGITLILISIAFFAAWGLWTESTVISTPWAKSFKDTCGDAVLIQSESISSADDAARRCLQIPKCVAYDFITMQQQTSTWVSVTPKAYFYSKVGSSCLIKQDDTPVMTNRKVYCSFDSYSPGSNCGGNMILYGDLWINMSDATYQIIVGNTIPEKVSIKDGLNKISSVTIRGSVLCGGATNTSSGTLLSADPDLFTFVLKNGTSSEVVPGPGMTKVTDQPNVSGNVKKIRKNWALYGGIGTAIVGILVTLFLKPKVKADKTSKSAVPSILENKKVQSESKE